MIKEILIYPKDKDTLTKKSELVKNVNDVKDIIQDMKDTLHNTKQGVGISAIQIGYPLQICLISHNKKDYILINPVITRTRGEIDSTEGCLSVPDKFGTFKRAEKVWIEYIDEFGNKKEIAEGGFFSRIAQHEIDHLNGWCEVFNLAGEDNG